MNHIELCIKVSLTIHLRKPTFFRTCQAIHEGTLAEGSIPWSKGNAQHLIHCCSCGKPRLIHAQKALRQTDTQEVEKISPGWYAILIWASVSSILLQTKGNYCCLALSVWKWPVISLLLFSLTCYHCGDTHNLVEIP